MLYIYIYIYICIHTYAYTYICIYTHRDTYIEVRHLFERVHASISQTWSQDTSLEIRTLRRPALNQSWMFRTGFVLYWNLTIISPTIISKTLESQYKALNFNPNSRVCPRSKGLSEIIVGEMIVKSPYKYKYTQIPIIIKSPYNYSCWNYNQITCWSPWRCRPCLRPSNARPSII